MAKDLHKIPEDPISDFEGIVGESKAIQDVIKAIEKYASRDRTVFLKGETGVGKNLVANALLAKSDRAEPYRFVNCGAIGPNASYESHFLGHEKGAFTGADSQHIGVFEQTNGGTIFLDEVAEMTSEMQKAFLNILNGDPFFRLGGDVNIPLDVRFIAATNVDFAKAFRTGKLRKDFYFRLNQSVIEIPPLRDRCEDIPLLVETFIQKFNGERDEERDEPIIGIEKDALDYLKDQNWPGNVRQLYSVIDEAVVWAETDILDFTGIKKEYERSDQKTTEMGTPPTNYGKLVSQLLVDLNAHFQNWRVPVDVAKVKRAINGAIFTDRLNIEIIEEAYEGLELTSGTGTPPTNYDALIADFVIDLNAYFQDQGLQVDFGELASVITGAVGMETKHYRQITGSSSEPSIPTQDDSQLMPSSEWVERLKEFLKQNKPKLDLTEEKIEVRIDTLGVLITDVFKKEKEKRLRINDLKKNMPYYTTSKGESRQYASTQVLHDMYRDIIQPILKLILIKGEILKDEEQAAYLKALKGNLKNNKHSNELQEKGLNNTVLQQLHLLLKALNPQLKKAEDAINNQNATLSP